jgi:hypothetical protein
MKNLLLFCLVLIFSDLQAQEGNERVIYKYKQYESFDLGDLEIKGQVIAPGDLSVRERQRRVFERDLFEREEFSPEVIEDIDNLR